MKLVAEKLGKAERNDRLRFIRDDGSACVAAMPRQGTLPHDLIHYVVESALPLRHGFLSLIASGLDARFVMDIVHDAASRTATVAAIQAEAIVEALQTQLWAGVFDRDAFVEGAALACAHRDCESFDFDGIDAQRVLYQAALELLERWNRVPYFQSLELDFDGGPQPGH